ncbi:MAG TPA: DUF2282 domain-containing protein [Candidatus Cybelea sp.]|nr:DUF2282 domain-containing protein [Candidatus Cybelea sp.]
MNRTTLAVALSTAVGLAIAAQSATTRADDTEKCFGVNAVGKNDCAAGAHSCAGMATKARDMQSFVLLPKGTCEKISGGHLTAS